MTDYNLLRMNLAFILQDPIRGAVITDRIASEDAIITFVLKNVTNNDISDGDFRDMLISLLIQEGYTDTKGEMDSIYF